MSDKYKKGTRIKFKTGSIATISDHIDSTKESIIYIENERLVFTDEYLDEGAEVISE